MAEDDPNQKVSNEAQNAKKPSKIPVRINSSTKKPSNSSVKVIVVDTSHPSTSVSKIPIRLSKSGSAVGQFKIKVVNSNKSSADLKACTCIDQENENEEAEVKENKQPKICAVCDCYSGICNQECLAAKKERTRKFMDDSLNKTVKDKNLQDSKVNKKSNNICPICKCETPCNPCCKGYNNEKPDLCPICKCPKPCDLNCEENKKKKLAEEEAKQAKDKNTEEICPICKCKKPCKLNCQENKNKTAEKEPICKCTQPCISDCKESEKNKAESSGIICKECKCKNPCNKNCEANKKNITAESEKVCGFCRCKKPCNESCEANKRKILAGEEKKSNICEVCKCTGPCNEECENKMNLEKAKGVCKDCKCTLTCNKSCEEKKKLEKSKSVCDACKCTTGTEEYGEKKKPEKAKSLCDICKCKTICNKECEEKKKLEKEKSICDICKCKTICTKECEEKKKLEKEKSICDICKCKTTCTKECEEKKKLEKAKNVCDVCECEETCTKECEEKKKMEAAGNVCEVCQCVEKCNKHCEEKMKLEKAKSLCDICKCKATCEKDCEDKKNMGKSKNLSAMCKCVVNYKIDKENLENGRTHANTNNELLQKVEVEEICKCIKACLEAVEANKVVDNAKSDVETKEVFCAICKCAGPCSQECETNMKPSSPSKLEAICEDPEETCVHAEIVEEDKKKVCETCTCAVNACHVQCDTKKKFHEEIRKPLDKACDVCICLPGMCNDKCIEAKLTKSAETCTAVKSNDVECGTVNLTTTVDVANNEIAKTLDSGESKTCEPSELVNELASVIDDINSSCKKAETITQKRCKESSSELKLIIKHLQQKCKMKDIFIDAMISDISERKTSKIFDGLLHKIANNTVSVCDFDRAAIAEALPKPSFIKSCKIKKKQIGDCMCGKKAPDCFEITVVKVIGPSLLIRWNSSPNTSVTGYHVLVNGKVRGRVFSRLRTSVLLDCVDLKQSMTIEVYPITRDGKKEQPAVKKFTSCAY